MFPYIKILKEFLNMKSQKVFLETGIILGVIFWNCNVCFRKCNL